MKGLWPRASWKRLGPAADINTTVALTTEFVSSLRGSREDGRLHHCTMRIYDICSLGLKILFPHNAPCQ